MSDTPVLINSKLNTVQYYGDTFYYDWVPIYIPLSEEDAGRFLDLIEVRERGKGRALDVFEVLMLIHIHEHGGMNENY